MGWTGRAGLQPRRKARKGRGFSPWSYGFLLRLNIYEMDSRPLRAIPVTPQRDSSFDAAVWGRRFLRSQMPGNETRPARQAPPKKKREQAPALQERASWTTAFAPSGFLAVMRITQPLQNRANNQRQRDRCIIQNFRKSPAFL